VQQAAIAAWLQQPQPADSRPAKPGSPAISDRGGGKPGSPAIFDRGGGKP
jgi:hypothetical protein